jgi:hypothetical protein
MFLAGGIVGLLAFGSALLFGLLAGSRREVGTRGEQEAV